MDDVKIIDNFLTDEEFTKLSEFIMEGNDEVLWRYTPDIEGEDHDGTLKPHGERNTKLFYMTNKVFDSDVNYVSPLFNLPIFTPVVNKLGVTYLFRMKMNLYPNTEKLHEHEYHIDYPFSHYAAIFSLNTCDGYTKFEDGTKVESIANRVVIFDASKRHCSSTTTNATARFNININYYDGWHEMMEEQEIKL